MNAVCPQELYKHITRRSAQVFALSLAKPYHNDNFFNIKRSKLIKFNFMLPLLFPSTHLPLFPSIIISQEPPLPCINPQFYRNIVFFLSHHPDLTANHSIPSCITVNRTVSANIRLK